MRAGGFTQLQIVDQLRQILDRIDVVMRRRRDQADARRRMTHRGDLRVDLVAGKLAALARLGALGDLDLEVVGIDQIFGGDPEPARGDLLDRRALGRSRNGRAPRRPRRCSTCRRSGSSPPPRWRAPRG
jgi:hypothetical protein